MGENAYRSAHNYRTIARLEPGVSAASAQTEVSVIAARLEQAYPKDNRGKGVAVLPGLSVYATDALLALAPQNLPRTEDIRVDEPVILFLVAWLRRCTPHALT